MVAILSVWMMTLAWYGAVSRVIKQANISALMEDDHNIAAVEKLLVLLLTHI